MKSHHPSTAVLAIVLGLTLAATAAQAQRISLAGLEPATLIA